MGIGSSQYREADNGRRVRLPRGWQSAGFNREPARHRDKAARSSNREETKMEALEWRLRGGGVVSEGDEDDGPVLWWWWRWTVLTGRGRRNKRSSGDDDDDGYTDDGDDREARQVAARTADLGTEKRRRDSTRRLHFLPFRIGVDERSGSIVLPLLYIK